MSENIAAAIAAKNEVIAQQGTSLDEVASVLETKAAGGTDISLGLTSASVGQIIKVKAIDASGKPTAWEAADMPSGGGSGSEKWELLNSITITETVNNVNITVDSNGNPLSLKKAIVMCVLKRDTEKPFTLIKTLVNNITVSNNYMLNDTTPTTLYFFNLLELVPGFGVMCEGTISKFNYNWNCDLQKMGYKYNNDFKLQAMSSFKITPNDGSTNIASGSVIEIFGVRA